MLMEEITLGGVRQSVAGVGMISDIVSIVTVVNPVLR